MVSRVMLACHNNIQLDFILTYYFYIYNHLIIIVNVNKSHDLTLIF